MKKFFSLIALVGVFAACQPEKLTTAFEVAPAQATINAHVVDILTGEDVTSAATITSETTLTGTPALAAQDYTVTATYKEGKGSATIHINALRPGGKANYDVVIPIGGAIGDYEVTWERELTPGDPDFQRLAAANLHYEGALWAENASEFILTGSVDRKDYSGDDVDLESLEILEPSFKSNIENIAKTIYNQYNPLKETKVPYDYKVSAWSLYNVINTITPADVVYKVIATSTKDGARVVGDNGVIATMNGKTKDSQAVLEEMQHPDYAGHWAPGHGHGEKADDNAGGGLIDAE